MKLFWNKPALFKGWLRSFFASKAEVRKLEEEVKPILNSSVKRIEALEQKQISQTLLIQNLLKEAKSTNKMLSEILEFARNRF